MDEIAAAVAERRQKMTSGKDPYEGVIYLEDEPVLDDEQAYRAFIASIAARLDAVPSEDTFNIDLKDEQEARRFRRRHLLLTSLQAIVGHNVSVGERTRTLQDSLCELSKAVREFQYDVERLDRGLGAEFVVCPTHFEAGETVSEAKDNRSDLVPERIDYISPDRKLLLLTLALCSVRITGMTKANVRREAAKISDQKVESLKAQEAHLTKSIAALKRLGPLLYLSSPHRFSVAEMDYYRAHQARFISFQTRFNNGTADIDEADLHAPRSAFDLIKVLLYGLGNRRLEPSRVQTRKR